MFPADWKSIFQSKKRLRIQIPLNKSETNRLYETKILDNTYVHKQRY